MMKLRLLLAALIICLPSTAFSDGKVVRCAITSNDVVEFKGKCKFVRETGGSFTLMDAAGNDKFYGSIGMVSVSVTGKDTAEVSGLVLGGNNSRWGSAKRSMKDRACWEGSDFRICAW